MASSSFCRGETEGYNDTDLARSDVGLEEKLGSVAKAQASAALLWSRHRVGEALVVPGSGMGRVGDNSVSPPLLLQMRGK